MSPMIKVLLGVGLAASVPIGLQLIGNDQQKSLAWDLTSIGLIGTGVGTIIGLWAVPKYAESPWVAAAILTAVGYATKAALLPHEPRDAVSPAIGELAAVYQS